MQTILLKIWGFIAPYLLKYTYELVAEWVRNNQIKREVRKQKSRVNEIVSKIYALEDLIVDEIDDAIIHKLKAEIERLEDDLREASRDLAVDDNL